MLSFLPCQPSVFLNPNIQALTHGARCHPVLRDFFNWLIPLSMTFPSYLKTPNFLFQAPVRGVPICPGPRDFLKHGLPTLKPGQPLTVTLHQGSEFWHQMKIWFRSRHLQHLFSLPLPEVDLELGPFSVVTPAICPNMKTPRSRHMRHWETRQRIQGREEFPVTRLFSPRSPQAPCFSMPAPPSISASFSHSALLTSHCKSSHLEPVPLRHRRHFNVLR